MKKAITIITFLIAVGIGATLYADTVQLKSISTVDGLPNSMVHQVIQDEEGFIWIATYYGLYRYDGFEYKSYKSNASTPTFLPSNNVVCLATDKQDGIWIGTHEGLCRLDKKTNHVKRYRLTHVTKHRINNILITSSGNIFIGTIQGMAYFDKKLDCLIGLNKKNCIGDVPEGINIQTLCEDINGDILVGTWGHGIYRYVLNQNTFFHYPPLQKETFFRSIYKDSRNNIWAISNGSGLFKLSFSLNNSSLQYKQIRPSQFSGFSQDDYILSIQEDINHKMLWLGTRHGVAILDLQKEFPSIQFGQALYAGFPKSEVLNICSDKFGYMWLSTKGSGILKITKKPDFFQLVDERKSIINDRISSVVADQQGGLWIGLDYGVIYQKGNTQEKILMNVRPNHISLGIKTGNVLIATNEGGIYECKDGKILHHYTMDNCAFIPKSTVYMVQENRQGDWFIVSYSGLAIRYANGTNIRFQNIRKASNILKGELTSINVDNDGSLWLTSLSDGVVHIWGNINDPEKIKIKVYNLSNGLLPVNTPICLLIAKNRQLWLGTEGGGLCQYDPKTDRFKTVHKLYNLPGDMVSSIVEDSFDNLWLGTNQGLVNLKNANRDNARIYTTDDGIPDNFFEQNAAYRQDDTIYFGTSRGLVRFSPSTAQTKGYVPTISITNILIDGQPLESLDSKFRKKISALSPSYVDTLNIPASVKSFTLMFATLIYEETPHSTYAYRLNGFDKSWHYIQGANRSANYTNLSAGTYTFEIKGRNDDGNWSSVKHMTIVVNPPFWATWWAYLLYIILAAISLFLIIKEIRRKMMLHNKLRLEVSNGDLKVIIDHDDQKTNSNASKKQLTFEIKDLNYTNADETFLLKAIDCVNTHLNDCNFGTSQLTEELATSRSTLFKKLKALTGMNASSFMRSIRLKAACQILDHNPSIRISDLAYEVGFNDPKYFSLCFKKEFGVLPSEYVNEGVRISIAK